MIYSYATFCIHEMKWMEDILEKTLNTADIGVEVLYFLYWQVASRFSNYPECKSEKRKVLYWQLFQCIYEIYTENIEGLQWTKENEPNQDLVIVVTGKYLSRTGHEPSKTAKNRCRTLIKAMNKKVLRSEILIDTDDVFVKAVRKFGNRMGEHYI